MPLEFKAGPVKLKEERAWRTYLGGSLLDQFHGRKDCEDGHFPEEWIMSVVAARNTGREEITEGLSRLEINPDIRLKDLIEKAPSFYLGEGHVSRYGAELGVLVKLIDSSERLTIQVHPDRIKAEKLFHSAYGKTECWHILGGREINGEKPCIYIGFKEGITKEAWKNLFHQQDIQGMLNALHKFEAVPGETILIEGGVPHAIGAGCFLAEIQEPTDFTIRVERSTPSGFAVKDFMCHQGLGFDVMFDCFSYEGIKEEDVRKRWFIEPMTETITSGGLVECLLGYHTTPFFKLNLIDVKDNLEINLGENFGGIYILEGRGVMEAEGENISLAKGEQFFLPASVKQIKVTNSSEGNIKALHFVGPKI